MADMQSALFGTDLFGEPMRNPAQGMLAKRFIVPPFTVLNTRDGEWLDRRNAWKRLGIESELGREGEAAVAYSAMSALKGMAETSIFDPVLCELAYKWFCPPGGQVVDPFAGGSVRGIVAGCMDMKYWGCELRRAQVEANEVQGLDILPQKTTVEIKVSGKMLRQEFKRCEPGYIESECRGRCCEGSDGISVVVHPTEEDRIRKLGAEVRDGYMVADGRGLCPFKTEAGLCREHERKPLGCKARPFTFTDSGTLIVRNRYRLLRCYKCEEKLPAFEAHRWSLEQILGAQEAQRVAALAAQGDDDITAYMPAKVARVLADNHNRRNEAGLEFSKPDVEWVCGDSMMELQGAPVADFVFSCPPYGNLEVYSDDERDLSNMSNDDFLGAYEVIIEKAVRKLRMNRFCCFVVADFRTPAGYYRNFVSQTIQAFLKAGANLYNEAVLVNAVGTAAQRATRQFNAGHKLVKLHQNVLVFCKGDWKKAAEAVGGSEL